MLRASQSYVSSSLVFVLLLLLLLLGFTHVASILSNVQCMITVTVVPGHGGHASYQRVPSLRLEGTTSHEKLNSSLPSVNCGPW